MNIDDHPLKLVEETNLLGVILTSDLKWSKNTDYLIKKANARMELLRKMSGFSPPVKDLVHIYHIHKKYPGAVVCSLAQCTN